MEVREDLGAVLSSAGRPHQLEEKWIPGLVGCSRSLGQSESAPDFLKSSMYEPRPSLINSEWTGIVRRRWSGVEALTFAGVGDTEPEPVPGSRPPRWPT